MGVLWGASRFHADVPHCLFKVATGLPCPGCGGLRAFSLLAEGRVCEALWLNPLSVLLMGFLAVSVLWLVVDIIRGSSTFISFMRRRLPLWTTLAICAILLLNWAWNIHKEL